MFKALTRSLGRAVSVSLDVSINAVGASLSKVVKAATFGKVTIGKFDDVLQKKLRDNILDKFQDNAIYLKKNRFVGGADAGFDINTSMGPLEESTKFLNDNFPTSFKTLADARVRKAFAGQYWETLRQLKAAKRYAQQSGGPASDVARINEVMKQLNDGVGRKIANASNLAELGPRYIGAVCVDHVKACVGGTLIAAAAAPTGLAMNNLMKCGRFQAAAGACDQPPPEEEDDHVADALLEFKDAERACFTACMPTNYSGSQAPYPAPPSYNTSELMMQSVQETLSEQGALTQSDRENLEAQDGTRPDEFQPYCTAEVDGAAAPPPAAAGGRPCEVHCIAKCRGIDSSKEDKEAVDAENEMIGLVVLVMAGIAAVALALFLRQRKKHALPDEEEKLLAELKNDL